MARQKRANGDARPVWNERRGKYQLRVELPVGDDGRRRRKWVMADTERECRAKATKVRAQVATVGVVDDGNLTVGEMMDRWLDTLPGTLAPASVDRYRKAARHQIVPHLGRKRLATLKPSDVTAWLRQLEADGYSYSTRRKSRAVLRQALRWAEHDGIVSRNVAAVAPGPKGSQRRVDPLTVADVHRLFDATADWRLGAAVTVMATVGLRLGECLGLRWCDVDLDAGRLTVGWHLVEDSQGRRLVEGSKAGGGHVVALPAVTVAALSDHRRRQQEEWLAMGAGRVPADAPVFTDPAGGFVNASTFRRHLRCHGETVGLPKVRPHQLRHTAASVLFDSGVPMEEISKVLNHASIAITADLYAHWMESGRTRAAAAMDEALTRVDPPGSR